MMKLAAVALIAAAATAACTADESATDATDDQVDDAAANAPPDGLRPYISKPNVVQTIEQVAAARGITNPLLIAGIANGETNLAHCRADYYTQQCRQSAGTPTSPSCGGGSVLVGNADSSCDQGGLGLFQIDYGTQEQTIAHYGARVLALDGNIDIGIDHILNDLWICSLTPSWGSNATVAHAKAIAWLNAAKRGTAAYNTFFMCMSRHYNGAGTQAEADYYKAKTEDVFAHYATTPPPPAGSAPGTVATDGTPLKVRKTASLSAAILSTLANGTHFTIACQKHGDAVTGTYGTSALWDQVEGRTGYVSDAYVRTGSDGQVAKTCP
jgi:hypothetical protein